VQVLPAGWPADAAVETVPDVVADFGAAAPGSVSVSDWSIARQLTGSLLPGQVRAGTGFSVASGSVGFPQTKPPVSPWGKGALKLVPGGRCSVYATQDAGVGRLALGSFLSSQASGSVSDPAVTVDLIEDQTRLRKRVTVPGLSDVVGTIGVDAVWLIDQIARTGGYYATPRLAPSCIGSLPLQGSVLAERGTSTLSGSPVTGWKTTNRRVYPAMSGSGSISLSLTASPLVTASTPTYITATISGKVTFTAGILSATVDAGASTVQSGSATPVTYTAGSSTGWPDRVQVEMQTVGASGVFTELRARARSGPAAAWSAWSSATVSIAADSTNQSFDTVLIASVGGGTLSGVQVTTDTDTGLWAAPTAVLDASGVTLDNPLIPADGDGWDVIQQIAAATLGGAWVSEAGALTYRAKDWMRGLGTPSETIVSETSLADVSWSIGGDDVADRVTVTYQPPDLKTVTDGSLLVWEATEAVEVPAGGTVTIYADIEGSARNLAAWLPIWDPTTASRYSRWAAATSRDGGGTQPADEALQVVGTMAGTSRVRIRITNTTGTKLWTVDGAGNPTLIVRANLSARAGESVTLTAGAREDDAVTPLDIGLGAWVQRYADAQQILDWVWSQVQEPRATIQGVRVKPSLARQLGDIIRITDSQTSLSAKALISGISLTGSAGQYEQTLDLVLLDVTFYDLSQNFGSKTFAQLSTDWAGLTFAQVSDLINSIGA
jgi:hypothetical protein